MFHWSILLVSSAAAMVSAMYSQCDISAPLPKKNQPIDWNEFNGTWYETATTMDEISLDHTCLTVKDLTATTSGFSGSYAIYFDGGEKISFQAYLSSTSDGHYRQEYAAGDEMVAVLRDQSGRINPKAKLEYSETEWGEFAYIGDPRYYIAYVKCGSSGWIVWSYTREKMVSADVLVFIHNDLLVYGVSAPLRLGRCSDVTAT